MLHTALRASRSSKPCKALQRSQGRGKTTTDGETASHQTPQDLKISFLGRHPCPETSTCFFGLGSRPRSPRSRSKRAEGKMCRAPNIGQPGKQAYNFTGHPKCHGRTHTRMPYSCHRSGPRSGMKGPKIIDFAKPVRSHIDGQWEGVRTQQTFAL